MELQTMYKEHNDTLPIGREPLDKINRMIEGGPFEIHIGNNYAFLLEDIKEAHRALDEHYLGKLSLNLLTSMAKVIMPITLLKEEDANSDKY